MKVSISKAQTFVLLSMSLILLVLTPQYWIQYPDSGYYLGTASNMIANLAYWFNGQPNLQYYPGTSLIVSIPLLVVGENFFVLQAFMAAISLTGIIIIAKYFTYARYGITGLLVPFYVLFSSLFLVHFYALISDTLFLSLTMAALFCWRQYDRTAKLKFLLLCCLLVSFSSLVRLQGLFFCAALGLTLLIHAYQHHRQTLLISATKLAVLGGLVCLPFVIWTARNYFAHSTDTFNMANGYFFGLKGLSIYAKGLPGSASAEHIQEAWRFPLERTSLFVGGLFESWYGRLSAINRHIITLCLLILIGSGLMPWARRANKLELLYVALSMAFISKDILLNKNLHIVYRYWLPMMPFIIVMMGLGLKTISSLDIWGVLKKPAQVFSVGLAVMLLIIAAPNLQKMYAQDHKLMQEQRAIEKLKQFSTNNIPKGATVATVDWGVLPHVIQRRAIPLLNDPDSQQSMTRMIKYETEFLVTYNKFGRMNTPAESMVQRFPSAFNKVFEEISETPKITIRVYEVNIKQLDIHLKASRQD